MSDSETRRHLPIEAWPDLKQPITTIEVRFERIAASTDAIQRAAYRFCDRLALELSLDDERFHCTLHLLDPEVDRAELVADFRIEVLDQVLRERIRNETEPLRNTILALAFSETTIVAE